MNAGIIIIGDEILIGQVVDINSSWISREMNKIGFHTETVITVGDDGKSISNAIDRCFECADVVFMTGGLGPTKDDITKKVMDADVVAFATPIYYYEMSGTMKTFIDRCNPLYESDYKFTEVYLIATSAEEGEEALSRAINGLEGFVECYPRCSLKGVIDGSGINEVNEALNFKDKMQSAYLAGKNV